MKPCRRGVFNPEKKKKGRNKIWFKSRERRREAASPKENPKAQTNACCSRSHCLLISH